VSNPADRKEKLLARDTSPALAIFWTRHDLVGIYIVRRNQKNNTRHNAKDAKSPTAPQ
jgi:hypothetical protein